METAEGVTFILAVLLFVFLCYYWKQGETDLGQIPSPKGLPIIGHVLYLDPTSAHTTFTKWSKELGGIFQVKIVNTKMIVLSTYDAIHEAIITRKDVVAGRPKDYRTSLLFRSRGIGFISPSPKWKLIRNKCHRHLKLQAKTEEVIQSIISDLVETFKKTDCNSFDPKEELYNFTVSSTCALLVGVKYEACDDTMKKIVHFQNMFNNVLAAGANGMLLDTFPWLRYFGNSIYKTIMEICALEDELWSILKRDVEDSMKLVGGNNIDAGLMAMILALQKDDLHGEVIDDLDVEIVFVNLLLAGVVTTYSSLYSLLNILVHHTSVLMNLQKEVDKVVGRTSVTLDRHPDMPYTQATIFELLRYTSIVPLAAPHTAQENTTLQGYDIPTGTTVILNLWAMHHDESFWPDPFEFKPERFLDDDGQLLDASSDVRKHLMPFGAGTRACIGEAFGLAHMFLLISSIVQHFHIQPGRNLSSYDPRSYEAALVLQPPAYEIKAIPRA